MHKGKIQRIIQEKMKEKSINNKRTQQGIRWF